MMYSAYKLNKQGKIAAMKLKAAYSLEEKLSSFDRITGETKTKNITPEPYIGVYPVGSTKIGNKELYIVEGASHVDLYDNLDKIPFDKIENFLKENLGV